MGYEVIITVFLPAHREIRLPSLDSEEIAFTLARYLKAVPYPQALIEVAHDGIRRVV